MAIAGDQARVREHATIGPETVIGRASGVDKDVTLCAPVRTQPLAYLMAFSVVENESS